MATCVPGVDSVTASGDEQYAGRLRVKVGPIHLTLQGVMTIQERDQQQWRAVTRAEANDRRVGGGVHVTAHMTLVESSPAATELVIRTQARLLGKLGEFGQPLIRKQADAIIAEFARNVAAHFHSATAVSLGEKELLENPPYPPLSKGGSAKRGGIWANRSEGEERFLTLSSIGRSLTGAVAGLSLAVVFLTILPLPAAPLTAWSLVGGVTVGLMLLGALAESRLRRG
jgi:carbon monoxide dehydrogenase subunit G